MSDIIKCAILIWVGVTEPWSLTLLMVIYIQPSEVGVGLLRARHFQHQAESHWTGIVNKGKINQVADRPRFHVSVEISHFEVSMRKVGRGHR